MPKNSCFSLSEKTAPGTRSEMVGTARSDFGSVTANVTMYSLFSCPNWVEKM